MENKTIKRLLVRVKQEKQLRKVWTPPSSLDAPLHQMDSNIDG